MKRPPSLLVARLRRDGLVRRLANPLREGTRNSLASPTKTADDDGGAEPQAQGVPA